MQYLITVAANGYILEEHDPSKVRINQKWVFTSSFELQAFLNSEHNL